jgi:hypothetical protein
MKTTKYSLEDFFNDEEFIVHLFEQDNIQCAEIEKWTDGGVDMNIVLQPFTKESFVEYVNDFNVDEQIDMYRQDNLYKQNFTISQSLKDFNKFHKHLKDVKKKLEKNCNF